MVEELTTPAEIAALADEWDMLAVSSGAPPFLRPGWITAWWEEFGTGRPVVVTLRRAGDLVAMVPLQRRAGSLESPTNWHTPAFGVLAVDADARRELIGGLLDLPARRVDLEFLEETGPDAAAAAAGRRRLERRVILREPFLRTDGEWDDYWRGISKNLRKTVNRCRNRLADRGEVSFSVEDGGTGLDALLDAGLGLESSGWKGRQGTAMASQPETVRFYRRIAGWAAEAGILRLPFLRIDGVPVAFQLSLEQHDREYLLKLGHDAALDRLGPGTVLTAEVLEDAFRRGLESYEFCGADDDYKLRWTAEVRPMIRLQAFAPTAAGRTDRIVQVHGRGVARRARAAAGSARERLAR